MGSYSCHPVREGLDTQPGPESILRGKESLTVPGDGGEGVPVPSLSDQRRGHCVCSGRTDKETYTQSGSHLHPER